MKFITPFKAAMGLSLLIHGGIATAYYAFWYGPEKAQMESKHESVLEIEVVSEPVEVPEKVAAKPRPVITSAPAPRPFSVLAPVKPVIAGPSVVLPEPKDTEIGLSVTPLVTVAKNQPVSPPAKTAGPVETTLVESPPATGSLGISANYLYNPRPQYPVECRRRKQEGLVVLSVQLTSEGIPGTIQIKQSSMVPLLDEAAVNAVGHWRFSPARIGSLAIASQIEVPVRFKLSNAK